MEDEPDRFPWKPKKKKQESESDDEKYGFGSKYQPGNSITSNDQRINDSDGTTGTNLMYVQDKIPDPGIFPHYYYKEPIRGSAIFVVNQRFQDFSYREGAEKDLSYLKSVFLDKLGFEQLNKLNDFDLTKPKLDDVLGKAIAKDYSDTDFFLFAISTHGEERPRHSDHFEHALICADDQYKFTMDIINEFGTCQTLAGKPKIFVIQACRSPSGSKENDPKIVDKGHEYKLVYKKEEKGSSREGNDSAYADHKADAYSKIDIKAEANAKNQADVKTDAKDETYAEADARDKANAKNQADVKTDAKDETYAEADARDKANAKNQADVKSDAKDETYARDKANAKNQADVKTDAKDETNAEADARDKANAKNQADVKTDAKDETYAEADARDKANAKNQADVKTDAKDETYAEADARDKANAKKNTEAKANTKDEADTRHKSDDYLKGQSDSGFESKTVISLINLHKDCLVVYAIQSGKVAWRHPETGSWLLDELNDVLKEYTYPCRIHFLDILTKTAFKMAQRKSSGGGFKAVPVIHHRLTKDILIPLKQRQTYV